MRETACQDCGEPAAPGTEFCLQCGAYVDWEAGQEAAQQGPAVDPVPAAAGGAPSAGRVQQTPVAVGADGPAAASSVAVDGAPETARTAPLPPVPRSAAVPSCSRCGTPRVPGRRFCARCALEFDPQQGGRTAWTTGLQRREPWWRRLFSRGRSPRERAALRAYRRSLPVRYRVFRVLAALLAAAVVVGAVLAVRGDPVRWLQARWDDVHDNLVTVPLAETRLDPEGALVYPEFFPESATDGAEESAWATQFTGDDQSAGCGTPQTSAGLLVTFDRVADVRQLRILPGLPESDPVRATQHRPRVLELRSAEGHCRTFELPDSGRVVTLPVDPPMNTSSVRIDVVAVYRAEGVTNGPVAISEIGFRQRPPH